MAYYNTTKESGEKLKEYQAKELTQKEKITRHFLKNKGKEFTPSEVWQKLFDIFTPITSIRRSITDLTGEGILVKTENQKKGIFGRNEHCWRYRD